MRPQPGSATPAAGPTPPPARRSAGAADAATLALAAALGYVNLPALGSTVLWAGNKTALKLALAEMDPLVVGVLRMTIAGVVLLAIVAAREGRPGLPWSAWPRMLLVGGLGIGLNAIFFLTGLSLTSVTTAALISTTSPVFCLALAVGLREERLMPRRLAGVLLALAGVALLVRRDAAGGGESLLGGLLLVGAAITWAAYSVLGARLLRAYGPGRTTAYSLLTGAAVMALASPLLVGRWSLGPGGAGAWGGLLYAALLSSVVGLTLWNLGIRQVGATRTMVYTYLQPALSIAIAAAVLGERLSAAQALGGAVVLAGLVLSAERRQG